MFDQIQPKSRYAYVTVTSADDLKKQKDILIGIGIPKNNIYFEVGGRGDSIQEHKILQKLIDNQLKKNNLLLTTKIDRCCGNLAEFLELHYQLIQKEIIFITLELPYTDNIETNTVINQAIYELSHIEKKRKEKQQKLIAYKAKKETRGRKTVITDKLINQVRYLKEARNLPANILFCLS